MYVFLVELFGLFLSFPPLFCFCHLGRPSLSLGFDSIGVIDIARVDTCGGHIRAIKKLRTVYLKKIKIAVI